MSDRIVIIGNGIAGVTAARHVRKRDADASILIVSGETEHFFSRTALMYVYMGHMRYKDIKPYEDGFWSKNRIELKKAWITDINTEQKELKTDSGEKIPYDKLVLATGSSPNKFGWEGQDLRGVQGLYSWQDLESMEGNTKGIERAVVVGGGLIGVEMAEMLLSRSIPVTFLVREKRYWGNVLPKEEGELVMRHMQEHHVDLRLETELDKILDDGKGGVKGVVTKDGEEIACQFVGLTAGVHPNIDLAKKAGIDTGKGIKVNRALETNVKDVYALGDCAEFTESWGDRQPIEQVWYTGRMMGECVARTLTGDRTEYKPGNWFNSAKFFDIEYQTYGWVWAEPKDNEETFIWEHEDGKKLFRVVWDRSTEEIKGINAFGIRMRHAVIDRWLTEKRSIDHCMEHLKDANFDPEFYKTYEGAILEKFNKENGKSLQSKKRSWKRILNLS